LEFGRLVSTVDHHEIDLRELSISVEIGHRDSVLG
jgi:hypothetical protein